LQLNRTPGAHQFLTEQTGRLRTQLAHAEEELRDLKNKTGLAAAEGQRQLLVTRIARLQDELLQTTVAQAAAEAETRLFREKLAALPPLPVTARVTVGREPTGDSMRGQLYVLQLRELELSQKYPEGHPELQQVRRQAAAARDILVSEEVQLALLRQEPVLRSLQAKADTLRAQLAQQQEELRTLNENALRVARLERDLALQESHYRRYAETLEQAQIDQALALERISNISIVQPATYETEPVRPRLPVYFGVGLLLAVAAGIGLAFAAERLDPTVKMTGEVEQRLGLRVLATVPRLTADLPAWNGAETRP
jgi:succinoglycan biosynthesis transport protein ExoP